MTVDEVNLKVASEIDQGMAEATGQGGYARPLFG